MKVKIKKNVFGNGDLAHLNEQVASLEIDKETGEPVKGVSGKTQAFSLPTGGRVYLSEDQYEAA